MSKQACLFNSLSSVNINLPTMRGNAKKLFSSSSTFGIHVQYMYMYFLQPAKELLYPTFSPVAFFVHV